MNLKGMTVNERLYHINKIDAFDNAINSGNTNKAIEILLLAELSQEQAEQTVNTIIENPNKYGYNLK